MLTKMLGDALLALAISQARNRYAAASQEASRGACTCVGLKCLAKNSEDEGSCELIGLEQG